MQDGKPAKTGHLGRDNHHDDDERHGEDHPGPVNHALASNPGHSLGSGQGALGVGATLNVLQCTSMEVHRATAVMWQLWSGLILVVQAGALDLA